MTAPTLAATGVPDYLERMFAALTAAAGAAGQPAEGSITAVRRGYYRAHVGTVGFSGKADEVNAWMNGARAVYAALARPQRPQPAADSAARSRCIGLPVVITVYDSGHVTAEVDLSEADALWDGRRDDDTDEQVEADISVVRYAKATGAIEVLPDRLPGLAFLPRLQQVQVATGGTTAACRLRKGDRYRLDDDPPGAWRAVATDVGDPWPNTLVKVEHVPGAAAT